MIETICDSVTSVLPILKELAKNTNPEPYTVENLCWTKLNVVISITAALIGGLGAYYGYKGFVYAKETARNVVRLSQETQLRLCLSLLQDLLLNYVRAIVIFCNRQQALISPSDNYISNLMLPEFEDMFNPESFYQNETAFVSLNDLKLRMRHYNHMIEVIESHCLNSSITDKDCYDLVIKTLKVTRSVFKFIREIGSSNDEIIHKLTRKVVNQTNKRTENVELTDKNKNMFNAMVKAIEAMHSYSEKMRLDDTFLDLSVPVADAIRQLSGKGSCCTLTATDMLAYNGLIEMQYLE